MVKVEGNQKNDTVQHDYQTPVESGTPSQGDLKISRVRLRWGLAAGAQGCWCPARGGVPGYRDVHDHWSVLDEGNDNSTSSCLNGEFEFDKAHIARDLGCAV